MIKAIIFDMDGVIIDSEPLWHGSIKNAFAKIDIQLTDEMTKETMGFRLDETVAYWHNRAQNPTYSAFQIEQIINDDMIARMRKSGKPCIGAIELLKYFFENKYPIALATSSSDGIIKTVLETLDINKYFQFTYSAKNEKHGKPDPDIYLTTAARLGVEPNDCLVFEDSISGVQSAKSAGMKCIAVSNGEYAQSDIADLTIESLTDFDERMLINM